MKDWLRFWFATLILPTPRSSPLDVQTTKRNNNASHVEISGIYFVVRCSVIPNGSLLHGFWLGASSEPRLRNSETLALSALYHSLSSVSQTSALSELIASLSVLAPVELVSIGVLAGSG